MYSQDELRNVMLSLGQPISDSQLWEMISHADMDGDGGLIIVCCSALFHSVLFEFVPVLSALICFNAG